MTSRCRSEARIRKKPGPGMGGFQRESAVAAAVAGTLRVPSAAVGRPAVAFAASLSTLRAICRPATSSNTQTISAASPAKPEAVQATSTWLGSVKKLMCPRPGLTASDTRGRHPSQTLPKDAVPERSSSRDCGPRHRPITAVRAPSAGATGPTRILCQPSAAWTGSDLWPASIRRFSSKKPSERQARSCSRFPVFT